MPLKPVRANRVDAGRIFPVATRYRAPYYGAFAIRPPPEQAMQGHRVIALVILALAIAAGCPFEVGRGGRIDVAIEKDMRQKEDPCPPGQLKVLHNPHCVGEDCQKDCVDERP